MGKRKVIWSDTATMKLFEILEFYNKRNQSKSYSVKLFKQFRKRLRILATQPEIGIKTDSFNIRGLIVGHFILFYEIEKERIIVHTVWDSRQDPEKHKIK